MKQILMLLVVVAFGASSLFAADDVVGLWKIIDDKTHKPNAIVSLYMYQGKLYGRILATISTKTGEIDDTLQTKTTILKKIVGTPPVCGLDFVYSMEDKGKVWVGSIIDPEPADEYECVIKKDGENLKVRGQLKGLGFLGRDQKWMPVALSELPGDTVIPDSSTFIPVIPHKK